MKSSNIIRIDGKQDTPRVLIDENEYQVTITGSSFNETAVDIYYQILDWIHKIENDLTEELKFVFDYVYINSSSKKMVFVILNHLERLFKKGKKVSVKWYFLEYDEDMIELGQDFSDLISLPFTAIPKKAN